jgi:hypothetical protein
METCTKKGRDVDVYSWEMMGHFRHKSQAGKRLQILINRERERERVTQGTV